MNKEQLRRAYSNEVDFAFNLGADSYQAGVGIGGNPFDDDEEAENHTKWIDGWNAAKNRTFSPIYRILP